MATRNDVKTEDIVRLRHEGMSFTKIAKTLGVSLAVVKCRWTRSGEQSNAWRQWEKIKDEAMRLWVEGLTIRDITERLASREEYVSDALRNQGITSGSIKERAVDTRSSRAVLNQRVDEIVDLYQSGLSQYAIAERLGIPRTSIATCLQRNGHAKRRLGKISKYDPWVREAVVNAVKDGRCTWSAIAHAFGVPKHCVANWTRAERLAQEKRQARMDQRAAENKQ